MYKTIEDLEQTETVLRLRIEEKQKSESQDNDSGKEKLKELELEIEKLTISIHEGEVKNKNNIDSLNARLYELTTIKNETSSKIEQVTNDIENLEKRLR